jgi:hypothetical protein
MNRDAKKIGRFRCLRPIDCLYFPLIYLVNASSTGVEFLANRASDFDW